MKIRLIVLFIMLQILAPEAALCQEVHNGRQIQFIQGEVAAVDWAGSKLVVRWFDNETLSNDEINFFVPDGAKVTKGNETVMGFAEIQVGDRVTVEYYNDSPGALKVISINVKI